MNDDAFKQKLTPEQYRVLRQGGTEAPFSGTLLQEQGTGMYTCAACGATLFKSDTKFESIMPGLQGWPSFSDVVGAGAVELKDDNSAGMHRTEVVCKKLWESFGAFV